MNIIKEIVTITQSDIDNFFKLVPVLFPQPFYDTDYVVSLTVESALDWVGTSNYTFGNIQDVTPVGFNVVLFTGTITTPTTLTLHIIGFHR